MDKKKELIITETETKGLYKVISSSGNTYYASKDDCTCKGFIFRKKCIHRTIIQGLKDVETPAYGPSARNRN